ncbi:MULTISPECIES: Rha family transcriptional regulator [Brevibacillus]|uniref:Rha family transcriptional regulator n=1 Tax=Brevibacillus TaxID=55080 RepID=UPI001E5F20A0|nr:MULTISPECIES: Rha family transcriptional regulator [Brevibacillus]MED1947042.1 Rha family transcriptional regulator [Brevibacillus formosus]MED2000482.1 Rha family transcriptional regulator [Brevibacillus formosus]MED2085729.1 Rha family transcriptional regulator [Brevibacillus formosus]
MDKLVFIGNGKAVTDSLLVAEKFGKGHDNVLRDIRNLDCSSEFRLLNFEESIYTNERGRVYPKVDMTRDGFTFLVMGYTGKDAGRFKEDYIKAFNLLEQTISQQTQPQLTTMEMVAYLANQAVQKEKEDARRDQELKALKSGFETITDNLTAVPDAAKVVDLINEYSRWTRMGHNEIYNRIYDAMKDQHGINVLERVQRERDKINADRIKSIGRPYAESTLKKMINGIDVMVRMGALDKFHSILVGMLAKAKSERIFN